MWIVAGGAAATSPSFPVTCRSAELSPYSPAEFANAAADR
jgi:hypothetical protein